MDNSFVIEEVLEGLDAGAIIFDKQGQIEIMNHSAKKFLKIKSDGFPIHIHDIFLDTEFNRHIQMPFQQKNKSFRRTIKYKNSLLDILIKKIDSGNKTSSTIFIIRQSDKKSLSKNLRQLQRLFDAIFQYPASIYYIYDGQGVLLNANRAAEIYDHINSAELIGKSYKEVVKASAFERSVVGEVIKRKKSFSLVTNLSDGTKGLSTGIPIFDESGKLEFILAVGHGESIVFQMKDELERVRFVAERYKEQLLSLSMGELEKEGIIADDPEMIKVMLTAQKLAEKGVSNILITGESGTGKGLLAKFIHRVSQYNKNDFIHINCANLPEHLLEAELFGYEKGAFTGASSEGKIGYFELANKGTVFLDEVGDLPFGLQAKLLKYLDDYTITRLGSVKPIKIECTVITATNRDLRTLVKSNKFREDLFYRLNTFTISIPPLRDRPLDIRGLTKHYLQKYNSEYSLNRKISAATYAQLIRYPFPGNVRQLKSLIQMAIIMSENEDIDPIVLQKIQNKDTQKPHIINLENLPEQLNKLEKEILKQAKLYYKSTREMSKVLKIDQSTVVRKLRKHRLV